jgi:RNA-binding protein Musashi
VTNASLGEFFQQFGGVVDAHVMLDRETSRNKGFGFVTFEDFSGVDRAMQAHNLILDGRPVSQGAKL